MLKYTTAREDVEDITNHILAIQAAEEGGLDEESLDTTRKERGVDKRYEYTLKELAEMIGAGDAANPAKRAENIYSEGVKNFIRNQHIILHFTQAKKLGATTEEAEDYAALQYALDIKNGIVKKAVKRLLNG